MQDAISVRWVGAQIIRPRLQAFKTRPQSDLSRERRGRVRRRAQGTPLSLGQTPNELWCTDYKGEFLLGNHQYCYPLTVTDHASRFLLTCEALSSTREDSNYRCTVCLFEGIFIAC
jgi:transposase InsO family protein